MTDNIVSLADHRLAQQAHLEGPCKCMECGHKWRAVRPAADACWWLECPACGLEKGRPEGPYIKDFPYFVCNCGNDLFMVTEHGPYCPHCNAWVTP